MINRPVPEKGEALIKVKSVVSKQQRKEMMGLAGLGRVGEDQKIRMRLGRALSHRTERWSSILSIITLSVDSLILYLFRLVIQQVSRYELAFDLLSTSHISFPTLPSSLFTFPSNFSHLLPFPHRLEAHCLDVPSRSHYRLRLRWSRRRNLWRIVLDQEGR